MEFIDDSTQVQQSLEKPKFPYFLILEHTSFTIVFGSLISIADNLAEKFRSMEQEAGIFGNDNVIRAIFGILVAIGISGAISTLQDYKKEKTKYKIRLQEQSDQQQIKILE